MRWGLWGLIIGLSMSLASFLATFGLLTGTSADIAYAISNTSFGVMGITLSIAILRYRLWDIDLIIRRTIVYVVLTAILALVYFGSVLSLQEIFRGAIGQQSEIAIIVSTLLIAALFAPLRKRIQSVIDRRLYRRKYDAAQVLSAFGSTARDEVDLGRLKEELLAVVEDTMQPATVTLWLKKAERKSEL